MNRLPQHQTSKLWMCSLRDAGQPPIQRPSSNNCTLMWIRCYLLHVGCENTSKPKMNGDIWNSQVDVCGRGVRTCINLEFRVAFCRTLKLLSWRLMIFNYSTAKGPIYNLSFFFSPTPLSQGNMHTHFPRLWGLALPTSFFPLVCRYSFAFLCKVSGGRLLPWVH